VFGAGSSALLAVLNINAARLRGGQNAPGASSRAPDDLTSDEQARIARELGALGAGLPGHLRPAGLLVVTTPFSIASGELTTNFKLRRQVIAAKFEDRLEELYRLIESVKAPPAPDHRTLPVIAVE
jgi:long-subunit acyl-CoA synthetase (AMP-forming)